MELKEKVEFIRESFPKQVKEGGVFLDLIDLSWYQAVNVDTLDLSNAQTCILGQKFGDYWDALRNFNMEIDESEELGFNIDSNVIAEIDRDWWESDGTDPKPSKALWAELRALWVEEIKARQEWEQGTSETLS